MCVQSDLRLEIEAFLAAHRSTPETTFGRLAVNDGKFVRRLRDGCNMTLATIDRVTKFIATQQRLVVAQTCAQDALSNQRSKRAPSRADDTPPKSKRAGLAIDEVVQRLLSEIVTGRTNRECAEVVTQPSVPFLGVRR